MNPPIVDAHQHVWDPARSPYAWLAKQDARLRRRFDEPEVLPQLAAAGVGATVLVQADDTRADTDAMLATAADFPQVVGVVGHVPLDRPDEAAAELERLRADPLFVGVRTLVHDLPDPEWLLRPEVDAGLALLEAADVPLDVPAELPAHVRLLPVLAERHPGLRIVIDHLAKPPIGARGPWAPGEWDELMAAAAEHPRTVAKVSGLYSASTDRAAWTVDTVRPFVGRAFELFGADRLMYGGDWPVSIVAGGYARVWTGLSELFADRDETERAAVLGGTAVRFYGLSAVRLAELGAGSGAR